MFKSILCGLLLSAFAPQLIAALMLSPPVVPRPASTDKQTEPRSIINVRVYSYAPVAPIPLATAKSEANRILGESGIQLQWRDCSPSEEEPDPLCHQSPGPTDLLLKLVPRAMALRVKAPGSTFGFTVLTPPGTFPSTAFVFLHRVDEIDFPIGWAAALGHVMAHEIGHLLLAETGHARRGIMAAPWRLRELEQAARGRLLFASEEVKSIRRQVLARIERSPSPRAPQLAAADAGNDTGVPEIIVRIYNYAGVGEDFLPRAQQEASSIFLAVGIRLSWLSCTPTQEGIVADPLCHQSASNVVSVMICPEAMLPKGGLPRGIFGFALMPEPGEPARYARLYFHRLTELADGRKVRRGVLFGAMMAHEIGHLLLGVNSHSGEGIMSIPWDARKLRQVDLGGLGFTAEQAATLKAEALRRAEGLPEHATPASGETGARRASH